MFEIIKLLGCATVAAAAVVVTEKMREAAERRLFKNAADKAVAEASRELREKIRLSGEARNRRLFGK